MRIAPLRNDAVSERIRNAADRMIDLDPDYRQARRQIAALELDILFYQDIGMEPTSYLLACSRLAPVQCLSFGHPNTTGIPNMDYFISNDLFEPEDAASHYSETLFSSMAFQPWPITIGRSRPPLRRSVSISDCTGTIMCTFAPRPCSSCIRNSTPSCGHSAARSGWHGGPDTRPV